MGRADLLGAGQLARGCPGPLGTLGVAVLTPGFCGSFFFLFFVTECLFSCSSSNVLHSQLGSHRFGDSPSPGLCGLVAVLLVVGSCASTGTSCQQHQLPAPTGKASMEGYG